MNESEVVKIYAEVSTLAQLRAVLERLSHDDLHQVSDDCVITFGRSGAPLSVRLIVDKLSDKSEVYNINIE
jgi:hypothetical protein